jgi:hypothetical protein
MVAVLYAMFHEGSAINDRVETARAQDLFAGLGTRFAGSTPSGVGYNNLND